MGPDICRVAPRINWQIKFADVEFGNSYISMVHRYSWEFKAVNSSSGLWLLKFDGADYDLLDTERQVRESIIRQTYQIKDEFMIPSELLYEAGLRYLNRKIWVDKWDRGFMSFEDYTLTYIVPADEVNGFRRPPNRRLQMERSIALPSLPADKKFIIKPTASVQLPPRQKKQPPVVKPNPNTDRPVFQKGEFLVEASMYWRDTAPEGRAWERYYDPEDKLSDNECFYLLDL